MAEILNGKKVAILATDGFEQSELYEPKRALEEAGAEVSIVSIKDKDETLTAWKVKDWGDTISVDASIDEAKIDDFDGLVLPGGVLNPDFLRVDPRVPTFVRAFFERDLPVAAICHGPWSLVEADVVKGRRMTSYPSVKTDLKNAGADWADEEVVVDGKLVTSRKPDDLPAFINAFTEQLAA